MTRRYESCLPCRFRRGSPSRAVCVDLRGGEDKRQLIVRWRTRRYFATHLFIADRGTFLKRDAGRTAERGARNLYSSAARKHALRGDRELQAPPRIRKA